VQELGQHRQLGYDDATEALHAAQHPPDLLYNGNGYSPAAGAAPQQRQQRQQRRRLGEAMQLQQQGGEQCEQLPDIPLYPDDGCLQQEQQLAPSRWAGPAAASGRALIQQHQARRAAGPRQPLLSDPEARPLKRPRTEPPRQGYAPHQRRPAPLPASWDDAGEDADAWQAGAAREWGGAQAAAPRFGQPLQRGAPRGRGGPPPRGPELQELDELFVLDGSPLSGGGPGEGGGAGRQLPLGPHAPRPWQQPAGALDRQFGVQRAAAAAAAAAGPEDVLEQYLHGRQAVRGGAPQASLADLGQLGGGVDEGLSARARMRAVLLDGPKGGGGKRSWRKR
jgi:hypothetical protein